MGFPKEYFNEIIKFDLGYLNQTTSNFKENFGIFVNDLHSKMYYIK
jgi:hypothetical protein